MRQLKESTSRLWLFMFTLLLTVVACSIPQTQVAVLLYHRVRPAEESVMWTVTPERLESDIRWLLDRNWTPLNIMQLRDWIYGEELPEGRWFLMTFDDGDRETAARGSAMLQQFKIEPVLFLITGDQYDRFSSEEAAALPFFIQSHTHDLHHTVGDDGRAATLAASDHELLADLSASREAIYSFRGEWPIALSWPFGAYDSRLVSIACEQFDLLFTSNHGLVKQGEPFAIPRYSADEVKDSDRDLMFSRWFGPK